VRLACLLNECNQTRNAANVLAALYARWNIFVPTTLHVIPPLLNYLAAIPNNPLAFPSAFVMVEGDLFT